MTGPIVVDVGNTRIKWGRCADGRVVETAALPPNDTDAWQQQVDRWAARAFAWVVSGVHPGHRDTLAAWLRPHAAEVRVLDSYRQLPLNVRLDEPDKAGIDRLLNAVAANTRRLAGRRAVVVDVGSAVTVDLLDDTGAFRGGAIFPGLRLMARALHEHTALLPLIGIDMPQRPPGTSTAQAIHAGVFQAVLGGVRQIVAEYGVGSATVYITGGDGPMLLAADASLGELWPEMTLHGILHSVAGSIAHG